MGKRTAHQMKTGVTSVSDCGVQRLLKMYRNTLLLYGDMQGYIGFTFMSFKNLGPLRGSSHERRVSTWGGHIRALYVLKPPERVAAKTPNPKPSQISKRQNWCEA